MQCIAYYAVLTEQNVGLRAYAAQAVPLLLPYCLQAQVDKFYSVVTWTYSYSFGLHSAHLIHRDSL